MAVLQKIRNKPKLLIGIIAIALLAFIFPWDRFSSFMNEQKNKAFEVNGDKISVQDYYARLQDFETFQQENSGQSSFDENTTLQMREFVYQQMVKEVMLDEQTLKLGLSVTDEELKDLLYGPNPSPILRQVRFFVDPQTRQFSSAAVAQFAQAVNQDTKGMDPQQKQIIERYKSIWNTVLNLVKYTRLEEKYTSLVASTNVLNNIEIEAAKQGSTVSANILYVVDRYSSVSDSAVTVTKEEIEKLYKERLNNFKMTDDMVKVSYFAKEVMPSESDYQVASNKINEAIEKLKTTDNPALVLPDYSEIPYQDIYFSLKQMSPEEANFAKSASINDVYGPVRDSKSYRAYKLIDHVQSPDSINMRVIMIPGTMDASNRSTVLADSIIAVINGGKDFGTVVAELNPQQPNGGLTGWITESDLGIEAKELSKAAFNAPLGQVSKTNVNGNIAIFKVENRTTPVDKYKLALVQVPVVASEETTMKIDNELNQFVADNKDPKTFIKVAQDKGYNVIPDILLAPNMPAIAQIPGSREVIKWAFTTKKNEPIKKFDLTNMRIVAVVDSKVQKGYMPLSNVEDLLKAELIRDKKAEKIIAELKAKNLTSLQAYAQDLNTRIDTATFVTFDTPNISRVGREPIMNAYAEVGQLNKLDGPLKGNNGVYVLQVESRTTQDKDFSEPMYKQEYERQNYYLTMTQAMEVLKDKMKVKDNRINIGL